MRAKKQVMPFYPITVTSAVYMDGTNKNFKDEYSETKSEIEQVRTATTGEKFNSVGERLNTEIGRLKKGYTDVNLVERDFSESHSIQNTCEGSITDLVIRGKTVNNLVIGGKGNFTIDKDLDPESRIKGFKLLSALRNGKEYIGYIKTDNIETTKNKIRIHGFNKNREVLYEHVTTEIINPNIIKINWVPTNGTNGNIDYLDNIGLYLELSDFDSGIKINFSDFMFFEKESEPFNINEYYETIKSFGQKEDKISILSRNKNLFNDSSFIGKDIESIKTNYPHFKQNIKLSEGNYCSQIEFTDGTKVMDANFIMNGFDEKNILVRSFLANNIRNLSTEQARKIAYLTLNWNGQGFNSYRNKLIKNISLIKTDAIINGEHYKEDKKDILLSQYGFSEGLRGIRTAFDELNYIRNVAIKRIEKYVFNNKENIISHEARENTIPFSVYFSGDFLRGKNNNINIICNCGFPITENCYGQDIEGIFGTSDGLYGAVSKTRLETADEAGVIKFLRSVLKECYYELLTPIETPLEQHIELTSYNDATYVTFENNIAGTSSFKLPVDISKTIKLIMKENKMLENKVDELTNEINQIQTYMIQTLEEMNN